MTNAQKFQEAVEAARAQSDLRSQLAGNQVDGVPVEVRVTEPVTRELAAKVELARPAGRRAPGATKADMIRQAYTDRRDEMVKEADPAAAREPIEVWLTQRNIGITCRVVREDETTTELEVDSLSMRGAEREMTGHFKSHGYEPAGRWEVAYEDARDGSQETFRRFRPGRPEGDQ